MGSEPYKIEEIKGEGIPIGWYLTGSIRTALNHSWTPGESYLDQQVGSTKPTFVNKNDMNSLQFLKIWLPLIMSGAAGLLSAIVLKAHYSEVDKYYLQKAKEFGEQAQKNAEGLGKTISGTNHFPSKTQDGAGYLFKQISRRNQTFRTILVAGAAGTAFFLKAKAIYYENIFNMNSLRYQSEYESIMLGSSKKHL